MNVGRPLALSMFQHILVVTLIHVSPNSQLSQAPSHIKYLTIKLSIVLYQVRYLIARIHQEITYY